MHEYNGCLYIGDGQIKQQTNFSFTTYLSDLLVNINLVKHMQFGQTHRREHEKFIQKGSFL